MSSRPISSALTPFQQAAIARALPRRGASGLLHNTMLSVEGRQFAVTAARPVGEGDWETVFSAVVARRASAQVDRLLPVVATGCHDGYHWVAYETGRAKPLVAEGWRRWPAPLALDLVSDVANTLDDAAAFGIVPYELLPSSIFMDARLGPLLGDLGAVREVVGSPPADDDPGRAFTPPEVIAGGIAGARSSVYVCGALLYVLLSGGPPRQDPLTRWRVDLPMDLDLVVSRAMARHTLERYRSAAEFCDSVRRALELPVTARGGHRRMAAPDMPIAAPEPIDVAEPIDVDQPPALAEPVHLVEPPAPAEPVEIAEPIEIAEPVDAAERIDVEEPSFEPAPEPPRLPVLRPLVEAPSEDYDYRPPLPPVIRRLRIALAAGAVVVGAVIGFQAGQPDPPARASGAVVAASRVHLTLPAAWSLGEARGRELLVAYPNDDWFAGLTIRAGAKGSTPSSGSDPVRLGELDMWRDASGAPEVVRYVLPTSTGPLVISCAAPQGRQTALRACERSLSTMSLDEGRALPLAGVAEQPGIRAAVARLSRDRRAGRTALARARTPKGQRAAALSLERANGRAARRLEKLDGTEALAAAAAKAADAYGALARAAGTGKKQSWRDAVAAVRRAETALARELKQQD
jgi:hypothetical protein